MELRLDERGKRPRRCFAAQLILASAIGVLLGTVVGQHVLKRIPEAIFQRVVAAIVLILGVWMFFQGK